MFELPALIPHCFSPLGLEALVNQRMSALNHDALADSFSTSKAVKYCRKQFAGVVKVANSVEGAMLSSNSTTALPLGVETGNAVPGCRS